MWKVGPHELFDHKDGLVKIHSLALWEHQLGIRHAQALADLVGEDSAKESGVPIINRRG
jgi:hypothetical protein